MLQIIKITYFEYQIKKCQVILLIVMDSILLAVEPIPGNGVDSSEKKPDPESSWSEVKKEPKSDSGADSRPGIITALDCTALWIDKAYLLKAR